MTLHTPGLKASKTVPSLRRSPTPDTVWHSNDRISLACVCRPALLPLLAVPLHVITQALAASTPVFAAANGRGRWLSAMPLSAPFMVGLGRHSVWCAKGFICLSLALV